MRDKKIALRLNFTRIKYDFFRQTSNKKEWFVEFHGGTNDTYMGKMVKIRLEDLKYFFNDFKNTVQYETERLEKLNAMKSLLE